MSVEQIRKQVRQFLGDRFKEYPLRDDEDIFALGIVNSLFAMQLVLFVEQRFDITVEDRDLELANFRTVDAITSLTARKLGLPS